KFPLIQNTVRFGPSRLPLTRIVFVVRCRTLPYEGAVIGGDVAKIETVLIVGAGIAGLTLGRALYRQGFSVELVERSTAWRAEGGGIAVQPNGMRMLRALG